MKTKELASLISRIEGKKSETSIGNSREVIACMGAVLLTLPEADYEDTMINILKTGDRKYRSLASYAEKKRAETAKKKSTAKGKTKK